MTASMRGRLERIPSRVRRELEIADVDAEARTHARADRHDDDAVRGQRGEAEAADEIRGPVDAAVAAEHALDRRQIVDQHHRAVAVGAGVEAERRALPKDREIAGVAGVELALAIAQAADERRRRLL